jgi:hypothetical protein
VTGQRFERQLRPCCRRARLHKLQPPPQLAATRRAHAVGKVGSRAVCAEGSNQQLREQHPQLLPQFATPHPWGKHSHAEPKPQAHRHMHTTGAARCSATAASLRGCSAARTLRTGLQPDPSATAPLDAGWRLLGRAGAVRPPKTAPCRPPPRLCRPFSWAPWGTRGGG